LFGGGELAGAARRAARDERWRRDVGTPPSMRHNLRR